MSPSSATKPNGLSAISRARVAPMTPSGAVATTMKVPEKLRICSMMTISISTSMIGCTRWMEASALPDCSTAPPMSMR